MAASVPVAAGGPRRAAIYADRSVRLLAGSRRDFPHFFRANADPIAPQPADAPAAAAGNGDPVRLPRRRPAPRRRGFGVAGAHNGAGWPLANVIKLAKLAGKSFGTTIPTRICRASPPCYDQRRRARKLAAILMRARR